MVAAEKHMKQSVCLKVMIELFEVVRITLCVHITVPGLISCNLTTSGYPCSYVYLHIDKYTTLLLKHWITILCILVYECKRAWVCSLFLCEDLLVTACLGAALHWHCTMCIVKLLPFFALVQWSSSGVYWQLLRDCISRSAYLPTFS